MMLRFKLSTLYIVIFFLVFAPIGSFADLSEDSRKGFEAILYNNVVQAKGTFNAKNVNESSAKGITALMLASLNGNVEIVSFLRSLGADVNATDKAGLTALMVACKQGHLPVVLKLLEDKDLNLNMTSTQDRLTALSMAAMSGHYEIVVVLLKAGADPNIKSAKDLTSFEIAKITNHGRIVAYMRERGISK